MLGKKNYLDAWLLIFCMGILFLSGCVEDANHNYIQGTWVNLDEHLQKVVGEMELETWWTFAGYNYQMSACCFIEAAEKGTYYILESSTNRIVLELKPTSGYLGNMAIKPGNIRQMEITINFEDDTLHFQRVDFHRFSEE